MILEWLPILVCFFFFSICHFRYNRQSENENKKKKNSNTNSNTNTNAKTSKGNKDIEDSKENELILNATKELEQDCSVIEYDNISSIISVPLKNGEYYVCIFLKNSLRLRFRKLIVHWISFIFEDETHLDNDDLDNVCIDYIDKYKDLKNKLESKLTGTEESMFCQILSALSGCNIVRIDANIFHTAPDRRSKTKQFSIVLLF